VIPLIERSLLPVFLTVIACVVAELPIAVLPKVSEVGVRVMAGAAAPTNAFTKLATFRDPRPVARSYPAAA
jgi:hypothetical protein